MGAQRGILSAANISKLALPAVALTLLVAPVPVWAALLLGVAFVNVVKNPWPEQTARLCRDGLKLAVIGLGAGMNLFVVVELGAGGLGYTIVGLVFALVAGRALGQRLNVNSHVAWLITVGTSICGGSAIAAAAPALDAKREHISVALGTVFFLNAIALFVFPWAGELLGLSDVQFGRWCALAIHDTSSVVGAASAFGERAVEVATATKLARALWIVPVTIFLASLGSRQNANRPRANRPRARPWFIVVFLAVAALVTLVPSLEPIGDVVASGAKRLLALTLFFMGLALTPNTLRATSLRPLLLGGTLWIVLSVGTLLAILTGVIA